MMFMKIYIYVIEENKVSIEMFVKCFHQHMRKCQEMLSNLLLFRTIVELVSPTVDSLVYRGRNLFNFCTKLLLNLIPIKDRIKRCFYDGKTLIE